MTIQILPPSIRQRIAAGEVIDRPASAVKELIENAIDAGARAISVEARAGGLRLIRVSDDGCGMNRDDAQVCTARFATSKIRTMQDLQAMRSLGFRGEALSSIVAVGPVEIHTRSNEEIEGTRVRVSEDKPEIEPSASPAGTSVTVHELFAHLPARRRFLKSPTREAELIQQVVVGFALAYPQIGFRLVLDGRERLSAPQGTLLARIGAVLGRELAGEMLPVEWQAVDLSVRGFVSRPTIARPRRGGQHVAVNGRPIRPELLAVMLERPYSGRLPPGRHPLAVIHITIDPHSVDVNVHPQKAHVRYAHERTVYGAVASAVAEALYNDPPSASESEIAWPFSGWTQGSTGAVGEAQALYEPQCLHALAQLHHTYILAETYDGLAIADQHAAHEQVLFEQLCRGGEQTRLSPPARLDLTSHEMEMVIVSRPYSPTSALRSTNSAGKLSSSALCLPPCGTRTHGSS